ncbi:3-methyl-2-oxobutanoate hydroxymethyltransferase [Ceratobasidium sp. AG-Ba]|nr:3-methyl-2-oxobutanoate hydroxymethyltransferase [Ceratobasidium sp. AG-Ba]
MSVRPEAKEASTPAARKKITIQKLFALKEARTPITVMTAYDYPSGVRCERADIDVTLVGDSLAQVALGYDSTTRLTLDEMLHHTRAVARGSKNPFLVVDMPFGTYHASVEEGVRNAVRIVREGGADAVKLEGDERLRPSCRHAALSGYRVQGKDVSGAIELVHAAEELQRAGAFATVLEAVPHSLATISHSDYEFLRSGLVPDPDAMVRYSFKTMHWVCGVDTRPSLFVDLRMWGCMLVKDWMGMPSGEGEVLPKRGKGVVRDGQG